jgi:aerobic carbon-monoxide dehydrogenase small subunit
MLSTNFDGRDMGQAENRHFVTVEINETQRTAEVEARKLPVHLIRDDFGLTGTHVGCDTSQCCACTVEIDGQATKSCTMLAVMATPP